MSWIFYIRDLKSGQFRDLPMGRSRGNGQNGQHFNYLFFASEHFHSLGMVLA